MSAAKHKFHSQTCHVNQEMGFHDRSNKKKKKGKQQAHEEHQHGKKTANTASSISEETVRKDTDKDLRSPQ